MRVIFAIDEQAKESHINNLPSCLIWAQERATATGRAIKLVAARPGGKQARVIAEATTEGIRPVHSGKIWKRKKLERLYG